MEFLTEYINMWKNFTNFSDRTNRRGYWMAVLINIIVSLVIGFVFGLIKLNFIPYLYSLAVLIPGLALSVRRLRDVGKTWPWLLLCLTGIGAFVVLFFLCQESKPDDGVPVV